MLKKTIKYTDFDGNEAEDTFFFHLNKAELMELEFSQKGGLAAHLERVIAAEDQKTLYEEFKSIILKSYGQKSEDGKRFIKNDMLREEFEQTEAFANLFMELATDADAAVEFVNGVIPSNLGDEMQALADKQEKLEKKAAKK